jgi:RNA polymerase sigma-70 factor (ECF subfamily)
MSNLNDTTKIGGERETFQTTHWDEIYEAGASDETLRTKVISNLLSRYWKPVYCHLKSKGYSSESAKDLTQSFFCELVLGHELIQKADKSKGKFRTFLLTTLDRYATNIYHKKTASKRLPKNQIISLDAAELSDLPSTEPQLTQNQAFHYAWASELLDQVLFEVKNDCYNTGQALHWEIFNAKVLTPIFNSTKIPSLTDICARYGVNSQAKASNMIVTVKRRFNRVLKRHLTHLVQSDSVVEEEFNELIKILSKDGAK